MNNTAQDLRDYDANGWFEVKDNPLSLVGVFPYLGRSIDPNADPDKLFNVLRPAEELSDAECVESFRLLPWIDNHTMLGNEDAGLTPAERKGVQGVIGENVYFTLQDPEFPSGVLKGNIKVFSEAMASLIASGKKELSCGYRCRYEYAPGTFQGQAYDYVQRSIRGNHLATVDSGRMGSKVAVQDHFVFTIDHKEITMATKANLGTSQEEAIKAFQTLRPSLMQMIAAMDAACAKDGEKEEKEEAKDEEEEEEEAADKGKDESEEKKEKEEMDEKEDKKEGEDEEEEEGKREKDSKKGEDAKGLDATDIARRVERQILDNAAAKRRLYDRLSPHIGAFDHSEMSLAGMARYGCKQLGLEPPKGQRVTYLQAYLEGKSAAITHAQDAAPTKRREGNFLDRHFSKGA